MPYWLEIGKERHMSNDYRSGFETPDGGNYLIEAPSDGGPLPDDVVSRLPLKYFIKSGSSTNELAIAATEYFTATDAVKSAIKPLDPSFTFYPMEVVDRVRRRTGTLWLLYVPHRVKTINLKATGDAVVVRQTPSEIINGRLVEFPKSYSVRDMAELVLDREAIAGLHLWKGASGWLSGRWFCSDHFKQTTESFRRSFDFKYVREE